MMFNVGKEKISVKIDQSQHNAIDKFKELLLSGELVYENKKCICGSGESIETTVKYDRYGIYSPVVICKDCSLPYVSEFLDEESLNFFYQYIYRPMYSENYRTPEYIYNAQLRTGKRYFDLLNSVGIKFENSKIVDIGCGPGGVLDPFTHNNNYCFGCDFDKEYMGYGLSQGKNLLFGDFFEQFDNKDLDLIIMSHVLEHINDPIEYVLKLNKHIKYGGVLLIEVPGINTLHMGVVERYFQGVHLFNFYADYLTLMMQELGYKVIYCDENMTMICIKKHDVEYFSRDKLNIFKGNAVRMYNYINTTVSNYNMGFNRYFYIRNSRNLVINILERLRIKTLIKKVIRN